jgi:hypothetical protein
VPPKSAHDLWDSNRPGSTLFLPVCDVANRTLQLFGGAGYRKDEPVERIWRSVRANRILAGTSEIMRHNRRDTLRNSAGAHMTITARQGGTP